MTTDPAQAPLTTRLLRERPPALGRSGRLRLALYSHDTLGLGHVRRNLGIAATFSRLQPTPDVLLVTGAQEARAFATPPGVDALTLPSLHKNAEGEYAARSLSAGLFELTTLRGRIMTAALEAFAPDVLLVDKVPLGAMGELEPALRLLRRRGRTKVVLGLRDVLDDPETTQREWRLGDGDAAVRDHYDAVWVYGDPRVYDTMTECGFAPHVVEKARSTGYLAPVWGPLPDGADDDVPYALCCVGGGQDGSALARAFVGCRAAPGWRRVLVTGPYMPPAERAELSAAAAGQPDLQVLTFVEDSTELLRRAAAVVAMGGYNTTVELLAARVPALVVPRSVPRREQLIRAERLAALGLLDVLPAERLEPAALTRWLADPPTPVAVDELLDLDGHGRLPALLDELVPAPDTVAREATP